MSPIRRSASFSEAVTRVKAPTKAETAEGRRNRCYVCRAVRWCSHCTQNTAPYVNKTSCGHRVCGARYGELATCSTQCSVCKETKCARCLTTVENETGKVVLCKRCVDWYREAPVCSVCSRSVLLGYARGEPGIQTSDGMVLCSDCVGSAQNRLQSTLPALDGYHDWTPPSPRSAASFQDDM